MKKTWIVVSLVTLAVGGYLAYRWWENYSFSDKFDIKLIGQKIRVVQLTNIEIEMFLDVYSRLPVNVVIDSYDLNVLINNEQIVNIKSDVPQPLLSETNNRIVLRKIFSPLNRQGKGIAVGQFMKNILKSNVNTIVNVKGEISLSTPAGGIEIKNLPVDATATLGEFLV